MPLTREDFAVGKRLAIFTDTDKPCATMLVFVHAPGPDVGTWQIEYVRSGRRIQGQIGPVDEGDLTPVEAFGLRALFDRDTAVLRVRRDTDIIPAATYKDGRPRPWQGHLLTGVHPQLIDPFDALYT